MKTVIATNLEDGIEDVCDSAQEEGKLPLAIFPFETKDEVLREFARRLSFPIYFGRNLDAFADAMHDFRHALVGPTALVVGLDPEFAETGAAEAVLEILEDCEAESTDYMPLEVTVVRQS